MTKKIHSNLKIPQISLYIVLLRIVYVIINSIFCMLTKIHMITIMIEWNRQTKFCFINPFIIGFKNFVKINEERFIQLIKQ
ncbi:hypothetical protein BpHYR1_017746 [Brachionus plicatilis]|uniref:Uncharacterized protein n=1 Tax=Brachionus plicatilis TaxID=10195 RepID=A0A3M7S6W5_BRAPC|nr:hypothetical protein BpHYR1_017746 [Brachionus plicatilis]